MKQIWTACCLLMFCCALTASSAQNSWEWEDNSQKNVRIFIQAQVQVPGLTELPLVEVRRAIVSEAQLQAMADCCMPGQTLFAVDRSRQTLTPQPERVTAYLDETADFTVSSAVKPTFYRASFGDGVRFISGSYRITKDGQPLSVSAELIIKHGALATQYTKGLYQFYDQVQESIGTISLQTAKEKALSCALALDASMALHAVQTVPLVVSTDTSSVEYQHKIMGQAYVFHFTRQLSGIPITYESRHDGRSLDSINDEYTVPFRYESLQIVIGEEGIVAFSYESPYEVLPEAIGKTSLLPLEDIQTVIKRMLPLKYAANARAVPITLRAHSLVFGYTRVSMRNAPGRYMLVPAWDLMGTYQFGNDDPINDAYGSLLTINATDGTVIDRGFGY